MLRWRQLRRHGLISVTSDSIEHRNLLAVHHSNKKPGLHTVLTALKKSGNCLCQACSPPARSGMKPRGNFEKEHVAAGWWSWSNNEQKRADYQHVPFHANIHCKYQFKKKNTSSYYPTSRSKKKWQLRINKSKKFMKSGISWRKTWKSELTCNVKNMSQHATCAGLKI